MPGGIGTYVAGLARALAAIAPIAGVDVTLLASRSPGDRDPLADLGLTVRPSALPGRLLTRAWDLGLHRAPAGFDVVHATSLAFPGRRSAPLVVTVHDLAWRHVPDAFPRRGRRWHERNLGRAIDQARRFVVPSQDTADDLVAAGASASRIDVIEHGLDHLPPPDADAAARLLDGVGIDGGYLMAVGTLEPRKNLSTLVDAYQRARPMLAAPWPLLIVGPQGWGDSLRPAPGVILAGSVPAPVLAALYAGARCVAYVPLLEGYGLPAAEAMRAGAPVVASPMPSTGGDGAVIEVDPHDAAGMARALASAAGDGEVRAALVAAGRARTMPLTWERAAHRHLDLWKQL